MSKLIRSLVLVVVSCCLAAGAVAAAEQPPTATPQTAEQPTVALADLLFDVEAKDVVTEGINGCSARTTCSDGCVVVCGGNHTCSVRSGASVTCDGRTFTCSGPRICPF